MMTKISSIVISEAILKDLKSIDDEDDEQQFQELRLLYISNTVAIKDFVMNLSADLLFENNQNNDFSNNYKYLTMSQFSKLMRQSNFDLFRPYELRQRFTEFMFKYKNQMVDPNPIAFESERNYK